jgi:hypothetical protein
MSLRFQEVVGDSRCPADAMCVVGGSATVRIDILADGTTIERELHTGNDAKVSYEGARRCTRRRLPAAARDQIRSWTKSGQAR